MQAALGDKIELQTLSGLFTLNIPPRTASGGRLRLKGKGLPKKSGEPGDLYAKIKIVFPEVITDEQAALYEQLKELDQIEEVEKIEELPLDEPVESSEK